MDIELNLQAIRAERDIEARRLARASAARRDDGRRNIGRALAAMNERFRRARDARVADAPPSGRIPAGQ
jgi:hypothetical protein